MNNQYFSRKEIQLVLHKALAFVNVIIAVYCMIAGMHFTFNSYDGMPTNVVAIICYAAAVYAFLATLKYEKSVRYLERKIKNENREEE